MANKTSFSWRSGSVIFFGFGSKPGSSSFHEIRSPEPSSGLDAVSEALVFEAIERLIEGKSALVIAQRFSTLRRAALILVVDDGGIVERGTHDQLLQRGGLYTRLYNLQFRAQGAAPGRANLAKSRISRKFLTLIVVP